MVPEFVFTSLLRVAHTEAGKNWGALFRADFLKENVEKSGGFTLNCNYILDLNSKSTSYGFILDNLKWNVQMIK